MSDYQHEEVSETGSLPARFLLAESEYLTFPAHWHEYVEVLYMLKGELTAVIQAENYDLTCGDLLVINTGEPHMTVTRESTTYILLQISPAQLQRLLPVGTAVYFQTLITPGGQPAYTKMRGCLLKMLEEIQAKEDGYQLLFTAKLYEFLYELYRNYTIPVPGHTKGHADRDLQRITKIMSWVRQNYQNPLTLDDAAGCLALSREYFCRMFKHYTGQTFLEYLNSVRTMHLYEHLKTSDEKLTVLMEQCGLTNYKVFMRTFKAMYGDTPQHIRARFREF